MTDTINGVGSSYVPSIEEALARIAQLEAQNAKLVKANTGKLTCKISEKGAVSVYGFGQWPVTLYASQWDRLFAGQDGIKTFVEANRERLAVKGEKV